MLASTSAPLTRESHRLPDVLIDELPAAELCALRLDHTVFPLGNAYVVADGLDSARDRIRGAFGRHSRRLIAELDTAAWIWGARVTSPARFEFCARLAERARLAPGAVDALREVAIAEEEIVTLAGRRVTSPVRTAIDLARFRADDAYDSDVVAALLVHARMDPAAARRELDARRHLTHAARARQRLDELGRRGDRDLSRP